MAPCTQLGRLLAQVIALGPRDRAEAQARKRAAEAGIFYAGPGEGGIEVVASKVLGLPARKASFTPGSIAPELAKHENATVLGLLHYGLEDHGVPGRKRQDTQPGFLKKLAEFVGIG